MFEEIRTIDLQLFAGDPPGAAKEKEPEGAEDDNPSEDDIEEEELGEEGDEFYRLAADAEEDEEEEEAEKTEGKGGKSEEEEKGEGEKVYTEEQLKAEIEKAKDEVYNNEPKLSAAQRLEQATNMSLNQLADLAVQQIEKDEIQKLMDERGWTEQEARDYLNKTRTAEESQQTNKTLQYENEKLKHMNNPLVKKYEKEIDEFAARGENCGFEPALNYILGKKIMEGELTESLQAGAENKTLADVKKQSKAKVEGGSQSGKSKSESSAEELTPEQKEWAANLGLTAKEIAAENKRIAAESKGSRKKR